MRIHRISIKKYKNIEDFDCVFSESNTSAFIGNNGSGKSNLLEVIAMAFSNAQNAYCNKMLSAIYPGEKPEVLGCVIEYSIAEEAFTLKYNCDMEGLFSDTYSDDAPVIREKIEIKHGEKLLSKGEMAKALPESIFLYYAGETQRQRGTAENTYDTLYETRLKKAKTSILPGLRFIDCYNTDDLTLLLAAAAAYRGDYYKKLLDLLDCNDIGAKYSLILQRPQKGKGDADTYWKATGFVKYFLDDLRKNVSATRSLETKYIMFFDDFSTLKNASSNELDLFAKLKVLKHYGYLDHVGIEFEKKDGSRFSALRLSEGEKQLTLLLLLLSFSARNNCLYLFDEFDAYLHLNWQRALSQLIMEREVNGHVIYTTHSPGTISQIRSEELYIMKQGKVLYPESETFNRALDEIMLEHMGVSMRTPEIEGIYDKFKQAIADHNKDEAIEYTKQLQELLDESDPLFIKIRILLRRIQ